MYQDDLAKLSKEELIALVLAQEGQIEQLTRRIAELEAKLGGPPKSPDNSSIPPSQGRKPSRAERRAAAVRANPTMTMNAGDHRPNRRQLDLIISVKARLICRGQRVLAVRAAFCNARDDPVRIGGQRPEHPGTALSPVSYTH